MTRRESAIVSAHTGVLCVSIEPLYGYLSELEKRNVYSHELSGLCDKHKNKIKQDFINLKID